MEQELAVVALVTSIIAMTISCAALWPQSQGNITKLRDGILWLSFLFVLVGILTYGWQYIETALLNSSSSSRPPVSWRPLSPPPESKPLDFANLNSTVRKQQQPVVYQSRRQYVDVIGFDPIGSRP